MGVPIFINLPVTDLDRSKWFYESLGWSINQMFTDDNAACVVVDPGRIYLMLLTRKWYRTLMLRPLGDSEHHSHAAYALAFTDRGEVDRLAEAALAAGGSEERNPDKRAAETRVGMYSRSFLDLDGHQWEPFYLPME
ncbi:VOC family protein [Salininema proteolyticum]|uniref:VOC family protein n=1 Tax=Salininema proteolyticum TaxID=1607685 RepID=A0ABV8U3Y9_9ACTN